MLDLISQWNEEFEVFAHGVARVCRVIIAEAFVQFPIFEVAVDFEETPLLSPIERLFPPAKKDRVEKACPSDHHEGDKAAGLKFNSRFVVNLNGEES